MELRCAPQHDRMTDERRTGRVESEGIEGDVSFDGTSLFISGGKSDYITDEDHDLIREHFPKALVATVKGAGHWVHAEKPDELGEMVIEFLIA